MPATMSEPRRRAPRLKSGVRGFKTITVNRTPEECFQFWRHLENLPRFVPTLVSVSPISNTKSHWKVRTHSGRELEWNADITNEQPNRLIEWRTEEGAAVTHVGSVQFEPAPANRGTEVRVSFEYQHSFGGAGALLEKMRGEHPEVLAEESLIRFRELMETGEIATIEGQPKGMKK